VHLPGSATSVVKRDGKRVEYGYKDGSLSGEIGSGTYEFDVLAQ